MAISDEQRCSRGDAGTVLGDLSRPDTVEVSCSLKSSQPIPNACPKLRPAAAIGENTICRTLNAPDTTLQVSMTLDAVLCATQPTLSTLESVPTEMKAMVGHLARALVCISGNGGSHSTHTGQRPQ